MRAIITGASGTVGTSLVQALEAQQHKVVVWDRKTTPIDQYYPMEHFVRSERPDVLFHLATASTPTGRANESWQVNYEWTSELAWICRVLEIRFVFTSSVMVFTNDAPGPFTVESVPDAPEGYGYEKRRAEERVFFQNQEAVVARLGWQIGDTAGSNTMVDYCETQMREHGVIRASTQWYPACSFLEDTVQALIRLAQGHAGLYLVDSNTRWNFYEIVSALNQHQGHRWQIEADEAFVYDQRMLDERTEVPPLDVRLPSLRT